MAFRVSRRRAAARGLLLLAGLSLATAFRAAPAAAQMYEPPSDATGPSESAPGSQPPDGDAPPTLPVGQADDGARPADQPAPDVAASGPYGVPPVKLMIPVLGVEAAVEAVGDDPDGAMSTPTDVDNVAWYQPGTGMGVPGNAVFAAHVNWDGRLRPFGLLHQLEQGDAIQVIDERGRGYEYVVESSRWVRAEGAPVEEIFAQPAEPVVTLITCGGVYIPATREYLDRLIVKARGA